MEGCAVKYVATTELQEFIIELADGAKRVILDGQPHRVDMQPIPAGRSAGNHALFSLLVDNCSYEVLVEQQGEEFRVLVAGKLHTVRVDDAERHRLSELIGARTEPKVETSIVAPMPGLVVSVPVRVGQAVSAGEVLVVLESMKMENEVRASQAVVIQAVHVSAGDFVTGHQVLLRVK
jgi:biotin carboxyl carrier protein